MFLICFINIFYVTICFINKINFNINIIMSIIDNDNNDDDNVNVTHHFLYFIQNNKKKLIYVFDNVYC